MTETIEVCLQICNQKGLHARAAAAFVKCLDEVEAKVLVEKDGQVADGSSILSLMMLAASKGSTIKVSATGKDAQKAIAALSNISFCYSRK